MKRFWIVGFLCAAILGGGIGDSAQALNTISGPITYNSHTYYLLDTALWGESETAAQTLGGHLVTINDQAENDWVWNTFTNSGENPITLWIGYYRVTPGDSNSAWAWSSGETPGFTNWQIGEPNNSLGNEDFAAFVPPHQTPSKEWFDMYAESNTYFNYGYIYGVVEVANSSPVPLPGAVLLLGAGLGRLALFSRRKLTAKN
jgi:hypothetical protein